MKIYIMTSNYYVLAPKLTLTAAIKINSVKNFTLIPNILSYNGQDFDNSQDVVKTFAEYFQSAYAVVVFLSYFF